MMSSKCGDPNQHHHNHNLYEISPTSSSACTSSTRTNTPSSIATLQNISTIYDGNGGGGGGGGTCATGNGNVVTIHNNNNNKNNNDRNKTNSKGRVYSDGSFSDELFPDKSLFIPLKHEDNRIYDAYFRREQRHLHSVTAFMTILHATNFIALDLVPNNVWDDDRFRRVAIIAALSLLVCILYLIQRFAVRRNERIKETIAILSWFLLECQILYGCATTLPRHVTSDGLSWVSLLVFTMQVSLPVGIHRALAAGVLVIACHCTTVALINHDDTDFILQLVCNVLVSLPCIPLGLSVSLLMDRLLRKSFLETKAVLTSKANTEAAYQEKKSLLLSVLPRHVAEEMIQDVGELSDGQFRKIYMSRYENVSILFADIVGFTAISSSVSAADLVQILNQLFGRFDVLANRYHQDRIKILGDCYYCVCGALTPRPDHAVLCIHMGLAVVDTISCVRQKTGKDVNMRVGIHTGACLGGVLGQRQWQFDVLGKEVTLANKMESGGIPARVHISESTKKYLNDEFELEPGDGGGREEDLRLRSVNTYLVKAVLKPYPQGTLDGDTELPSIMTNPQVTTTTTTGGTNNKSTANVPTKTNVPVSKSTITNVTSINNTVGHSNPSISITPAASEPVHTNHNNMVTTTPTTINVNDPKTDLTTPAQNSFQTHTNDSITKSNNSLSNPMDPTLHLLQISSKTSDSASLSSSQHSTETQQQQQQQKQQQQQQQQQQQRYKRKDNIKSTERNPNQPVNQQRSQSVKSPNHKKDGLGQTKKLSPSNEGIHRHAKSRTTIAATSGRGLHRHLNKKDDDGEGVVEDEEDERLYDMEEELKRRSAASSSIEKTDILTALEEKEANRTLGSEINHITLGFKDVTMETMYKHRSQCYSALPLVAMSVVFPFLVAARFTILPRTMLAVISFIFGQLILTLMAVISMAATYTKTFPTAMVRFALTIECHAMARMLWGFSACAVFFLCDVIPITVCRTTSLNYTALSDTSTHELDTQDTVCQYVIYYAHTNTLSLFAIVSLVNVGHVMKVLVMEAMAGVQCLIYLVIMDGAFDNYDALVYYGVDNYTSTKYRLVSETLAIPLVLALFDRKMELLTRKLFLWKEESEMEKEKAVGLQRKNEALVFNLMPEHVAKDFIGNRRNKRGLYSRAHEETGVIFASCPNFNAFYNESAVNNNGLECLRFLNEIISDYDELLNQTRFSSIVKIKTVGATYMAVSGMTASGLKPFDFTARWSHLNDLVQFAFGLQDVLRKINEQSFNNFILRIGINHGPLIAGVIGATKPHYDVWGNTVNVASRMESTGQPGRIQVAEETKDILVRFGYHFESRGLINVKGKGEMVTYFLEKTPRSQEINNDVMPNQVPDS